MLKSLCLLVSVGCVSPGPSADTMARDEHTTHVPASEPRPTAQAEPPIDAAGGEPIDLGACTFGCCGPDERTPDPQGHIECCFCGPDEP